MGREVVRAGREDKVKKGKRRKGKGRQKKRKKRRKKEKGDLVIWCGGIFWRIRCGVVVDLGSVVEDPVWRCGGSDLVWVLRGWRIL